MKFQMFTFKKRTDSTVDNEFYRSLKRKKRIKRKGYFINALLVVIFLFSLIAYSSSLKEEKVYSSPTELEFVENYIGEYFAFPYSDEQHYYLKFSNEEKIKYTEDIKAVSVQRIEYIASEFTLKNNKVSSKYNVRIELELVKEVITPVDGQEPIREEIIENQVLYRTLNLLSDSSRKQFYVQDIYSEQKGFEKLQVDEYTPKLKGEALTPEEKRSAEILLDVLFNQWNDDYLKAVELMDKGASVYYKQPSDSYEYVGIENAVKSSNGNRWYMVVKIKVVNSFSVEYRMLEIEFNRNNGLYTKIKIV